MHFKSLHFHFISFQERGRIAESFVTLLTFVSRVFVADYFVPDAASH